MKSVDKHTVGGSKLTMTQRHTLKGQQHLSQSVPHLRKQLMTSSLIQ